MFRAVMFSHTSTILVEQSNETVEKATLDFFSMNHVIRQKYFVFKLEGAQLGRYMHFGLQDGKFQIFLLEIARTNHAEETLQ